jgi:hypothetical protein
MGKIERPNFENLFSPFFERIPPLKSALKSQKAAKNKAITSM